MSNVTIRTVYSSMLGLLIILALVGHTETPTVVGGVHDGIELAVNTLHGRDLFENYFGMSISKLLLSLRLILCSICLSVIMGFLIAIIRVRGSRWIRVSVGLLVDVFESIPEAMIAVITMAVVLYSMVDLGIRLPAYDYNYPTWIDTLIPSLVLALPSAFLLQRHLYIRFNDEIGTHYPVTALAKGLSVTRVFYTHIVPNTISTVLAQVPGMSAMILSSVLFVEVFLGYQGAFAYFPIAFNLSFLNPGSSFDRNPGLPAYQPGILFILCALLLLVWGIINLGCYIIRKIVVIDDVKRSLISERRKFDKKWIIVGTILCGFVLITGIHPQFFTLQDPNQVHLADIKTGQSAPFPPSQSHLFGTDDQGRDLLSRTLHGTIITLFPAFFATVSVIFLSLIVATLAFLQSRRWVFSIIRFLNDTFTALPVVLVLILILSPTHVHSHHQLLTFTLWIVVVEIGRVTYLILENLLEWEHYDFVEGAISIGCSRLRIVLHQFRPWLLRSLSELLFSQFVRILSLMTVLAAFHIYVYEKIGYIPFHDPPKQGIIDASMSWMSTIGDATTYFSFESYPYLLYGSVLALSITMIGGKSHSTWHSWKRLSELKLVHFNERAISGVGLQEPPFFVFQFIETVSELTQTLYPHVVCNLQCPYCTKLAH